MKNEKISTEYPALSTIILILNITGIIIVVFSVISIIFVLVQLSNHKIIATQAGFYMSISLVGGLLISILYFALAELIKLFVKIEFNTRKISSNENHNSIIGRKIRQTKASSNDFVINYDEWKKNNPTKTLNDYYSAMRNK